MHTPLLNTVEHGTCDTQWHIKYKVAFKLNMVTISCDSIMTTTDYHTFKELLRFITIMQFYSWGHYLTLNRDTIRATTLHGT